jgi:hypothetical protein
VLVCLETHTYICITTKIVSKYLGMTTRKWSMIWDGPQKAFIQNPSCVLSPFRISFTFRKKFLAVFIRRILIDAKAKVSLIKVETEGRHCLPENDLTGLPTSTDLWLSTYVANLHICQGTCVHVSDLSSTLIKVEKPRKFRLPVITFMEHNVQKKRLKLQACVKKILPRGLSLIHPPSCMDRRRSRVANGPTEWLGL